jgi:hypothetical protein
MNIMEFAGEWLMGLDLNGRTVTVVIDHVSVETVQNQQGQRRDVPAVAFRSLAGQPLRKRLLLTAKTNIVDLAKLFGTDTDAWVGQAVQLKPVDVSAFGQIHNVVRIAGRGKLPATNGNGATVATPTQPAPADNPFVEVPA